MEEGLSWLGGHDWTSVEVASGTSPSLSMEGILLPGEDVIAQAQAVVLINIDGAGNLFVTNFRLVFVISDGLQQLSSLGTIPLATIEKIAKQENVRTPASRTRGLSSLRLLQIVGKDMRTIVFGFRPHQRRGVYDTLMRLTRPARLWDLYAFSRSWQHSSQKDPRTRLRDEYLRIISSGRGWWRLSDVNSDYMLCPTYPSLLVMPKGLSDDEIQQAAAFRARGRLPALCWQHPENGAILARSSQPLIGIMMNSRSNADEKLVAALCTPLSIGGQRRKLYIADARPRKNALANGAMGGGSESSANYSQCEVAFLGIDNIHAMRDSLSRLREFLDMHGAASSDGSSSLLRSGGSSWGGGNLSSMAAAVSALGDCGWLTHVHTVLAGAAWITARVSLEGSSVLVHCSDGWDRTTQLVALAEVMLDPYYRTLAGFQALVEKDWLAFGHPFSDRLGMPTLAGSAMASDLAAAAAAAASVSAASSTGSPARVAAGSSFTSATSQSSATPSYNTSPIFLQWIDCVSQLLRLYPRAFEFSSAYLVDLVDLVLSCRFGNFLCNSERERLQASVAESCGCIWSYFEQRHAEDHEHLNFFYSRSSHPGALLPPAAALAPSLWPQFYLRWVFPPDKSTYQQPHATDIENQARMLWQRVSSLERVRDKSDERVKELVDAVDCLKEELRVEKDAHSCSKAAAMRASKETSALKRAVETMGCKISFSGDDDEIRSAAGDDDNGFTGRAGDVSISVSVVTESDTSANMLRKKDTSGGTTGTTGSTVTATNNGNCAVRESCKWPETGCARLGSALLGLKANFDALQQLSILDRYFDLEHQQESRHSPGVT